jgi:putative Holliday junction resolvase
MKPVAALDYGRKRVGLAISDRLGLLARPVGTYTQEEAIRVLEHLVHQEGIEVLVVGWPLDMEGWVGEAAREVEAYMRRIERRLPGLRLIRWDERFSTVQAQQLLRLSGLPRRARQDKGRLDRAAAALILQEYLDAQRLCPDRTS